MMAFFKKEPRKDEERRAGKDRRRYVDSDYKGPERRIAEDRRLEIDRKKLDLYAGQLG